MTADYIDILLCIVFMCVTADRYTHELSLFSAVFTKDVGELERLVCLRRGKESRVKAIIFLHGIIANTVYTIV